MNKFQSWIKRRQRYFFLLRFNNSSNRQLMCRATWPSVGKKVKASLEYWHCLQYWSSFLIQSLYDHRGTEDVSTGTCQAYEVIVQGMKVLLIVMVNASYVYPTSLLFPVLYLPPTARIYIFCYLSVNVYMLYIHTPSGCEPRTSAFSLFLYLLCCMHHHSFLFLFVNSLLHCILFPPPIYAKQWFSCTAKASLKVR